MSTDFAASSRRTILWGALFGLAALGMGAWFWDFTVDDALISVRYARHIASGAGYRFQTTGPMTDGVTPLPWPWLLAPLSHASAWAVLGRAKLVGLGLWVLAATSLGAAIGRTAAPSWAKGVALAAVFLSLPIATHPVSGMETGLAMALTTFAVLAMNRPLLAAGLAGAAAMFRPELAPWAVALAFGASPPREGRWSKTLAAVAVALVPFAACALVRLAVFGRPAPLSVLAKPSDFSHGINYGVASTIASLTPILVLAPRALVRAPSGVRAVVFAFGAHLMAVGLVGGDWMPFARLMAPVAPTLAWAFVHAIPEMSVIAAAIRSAVALFLGITLQLTVGTRGRHVGSAREAMASAATAFVSANAPVAALDIGWLSAITDAPIVDLAGLTDPEIAALPGGHTSKHVDLPMLLDRRVGTIVIYAKSQEEAGTCSRGVEQRIMQHALFRERFRAIGFVPLDGTSCGYTFYTRAPSSPE